MNVLRPLACLLPEGTKTGLIILNRPIDIPLMKHLWKTSVFTALTDGAVNELHKSFGDQKDEYIPHIITGDFDSASPATLDYYKNKNVDIMPTPDQDETDFTKCFRIVCDRMDQNSAGEIIALGAFGGRMDHIMANINTLYTSLKLSKLPLYLFYDCSMACLLDKGKHKLLCDTGMEAKDRMAFGELISTSNTLAAQEVTVTTDEPLLWVMGYKSL